MGRFDRLKREAREACERRGHDMKHFNTLARPNPSLGIHGTVARSYCLKCGAMVQVEMRGDTTYINFASDAPARVCK